jgi:hypothetical protein
MIQDFATGAVPASGSPSSLLSLEQAVITRIILAKSAQLVVRGGL